MGKQTNPFYKTGKWLKKRDRILRRDKYLCQQSKRYGNNEQAEMVHHIYPLEQYPELAFASWNLISLSNKQHGRMHNRTTNEVTALGKEWQDRVRDRFDEWRRSV